MRELVITLTKFISLLVEWTIQGITLFWYVWKQLFIGIAFACFVIFLLLCLWSIFYHLHTRFDRI